MQKKPFISLLILIVLCAGLVAACAPAAAEPTTAPVEATAEPVEEEETVPEVDPLVGGKLVIATNYEMVTLDTVLAPGGDALPRLMGGSLIALTADHQYVPYLAKSWEVSEDRLTWTFHLREDVQFHNGDPLTAHDFAWTYNRILNPETGAGMSKEMLGSVASVEAPDDTTLVITLAAPYGALLYNLSSAGLLQPQSQRAVEEAGANYGRNPVGVGPYMLKEWITGDHLTFIRNPDYTWGPDFGNGDPFYIEEIEFRYITEYATTMAGLESGEIDIAEIEAKDYEYVLGLGEFQIFDGWRYGLMPFICLNNSVPPFDTDINVRKAFNMAVDKQALVEVMENGLAQPQAGPLSPSQIGYDPAIEEYGYPYDPEAAIALLEESGYSMNADGIMEKDGQPLSFKLIIVNLFNLSKYGEMLKEQYKAIGVDLEIELVEMGMAYGVLLRGEYEVTLMGFDWQEGSDMLMMMMHSERFNLPRINDPELDERLMDLAGEGDVQVRQEKSLELQKFIIDQAYYVPLIAVKELTVVRNRVHDALFSPLRGLYFDNAYIEE